MAVLAFFGWNKTVSKQFRNFYFSFVSVLFQLCEQFYTYGEARQCTSIFRFSYHWKICGCLLVLRAWNRQYKIYSLCLRGIRDAAIKVDDVCPVGAPRQRLMVGRCKSDYELVCMDFKVGLYGAQRSDSTTTHSEWDTLGIRQLQPPSSSTENKLRCRWRSVTAPAAAALCSRARSSWLLRAAAHALPSICETPSPSRTRRVARFCSAFVCRSRNDICHNPRAVAQVHSLQIMRWMGREPHGSQIHQPAVCVYVRRWNSIGEGWDP